MLDKNLSRREFLRNAALAASISVLVGCSGSVRAGDDPATILARLKQNAQGRGAEGMGAVDVPDNVSWRTALDAKPDDGEPIHISGSVYRVDGRTPAPNTLIYFYHTDKYGIYGRQGQPKHGRFRGWMLTDARGRYEFASIRPASYPNSTQSQHIHMTVTTVESREDWIDSILFEGDPLIMARERQSAGRRGGFNPIVTLQKGKDGVLRAKRDIRLMA